MYEDEFFKNNTWIWGGKQHWAFSQPEFMKLVQDRDKIYWTPNTITSEVKIDKNVAYINLYSETPNFKEYQMRELPSGNWKPIGDKLALKLRKKEYEWAFRVVNIANVTGPERKIFIRSK